MKFKKEDQSVDASVLLRRVKILTGGKKETMCEAETKGKAIQTAQPEDPLHIQSPNSDTIADAGKCLLTGV